MIAEYNVKINMFYYISQNICFFPLDQYTKIQTPRQEVIFKKNAGSTSPCRSLCDTSEKLTKNKENSKQDKKGNSNSTTSKNKKNKSEHTSNNKSENNKKSQSKASNKKQESSKKSDSSVQGKKHSQKEASKNRTKNTTKGHDDNVKIEEQHEGNGDALSEEYSADKEEDREEKEDYYNESEGEEDEYIYAQENYSYLQDMQGMYTRVEVRSVYIFFQYIQLHFFDQHII